MHLRKLILRPSMRITLNVFSLFVVLLALIAGYTVSQGQAHATSLTSPASNTASAIYGVPTANKSMLRAASSLPSGCTNDSKVDYPGAIDCVITPPTTYDCNNELSPSNCTYTSSDRPNSCSVWVGPNQPLAVTQPCKINQVVIHDTESSLTSTLNEFMCLGNNPNNSSCEQASVHYVIDLDGTVYQVVREQDISYHDGNFWSNMHSVGIEHVGYNATGYQWYNSTQYLASARLVAYLLKKYHLPLDRSHILAHGTVPSSTLSASPNHVDPGPYWLWDYYFHLIHQQGVPLNNAALPHTITLHPQTDQVLNGPMGPYGQEETPADYSFFDLYTGPSTASGLIPAENTSDPTDVSYNVEPGISYYYLNKVHDPAGTGDTLYEIWYGEEDQLQSSTPSYFADAKLVWLAVPPGDGVDGTLHPEPDMSHTASLVKVKDENAQIYSRPVTNSLYVIGSSASGAIFFTGYTVIEDNTRSNLWYEINYNHRQAWVPASEVTCIRS